MPEPSALELAWDMRRAVRGGPPALEARQHARLAALIDHARARSPYYADLYRDLPTTVLDDIRQFPPTSKHELMARFDEWVTDPAITRAGVEAFLADPGRVGQPFLGQYMVFTTSGSTGDPAILVHDPFAWKVYNTLAYVRALSGALRPGVLWGVMRMGSRAAAVFVTGGHFGGVAMVQRRVRERPWRAKMQRVFSALTPIPELVRQLNEFQPAMLGGYPSVLNVLAQEQQAGRLHIHPVVVSAAGETLTPAMRQRIETVFGVRVTDTYSASEVVGITTSCAQGRLHVNSDWTILEPVDEDYQPVPPGVRSNSVLVTNLANRVQPVIRYELGDSVTVLAEPCLCGSPLPAIQVEGRTNDTLVFRGPTGETVSLLPLALGTVIEETPGVYRFQAVQTGHARLDIRLEAVHPEEIDVVWAAVKRNLRAWLAAQGLPDIAVIRSPELICVEKSGKLRQVWSDVPHADS